MRSAWTWISSVCRQKRILIILCTFGSSFIAFNYSLLSTSTTNPTLNSFIKNRIVNKDRVSARYLGKNKELDSISKQQPTFPSELSLASSSQTSISSHVFTFPRKRRISHADTESRSSNSSQFSHKVENAFASQLSRLQPSNLLLTYKNTHKAENRIKETDMVRAHFPSKQSYTNNNKYIQPLSSDLPQDQRRNNNYYSSKNQNNNAVSIDFSISEKTDEMNEPIVASSSTTTSSPSEIKETSIIISSSNKNKIDAVTPELSGRIPQLSSSKFPLPAKTTLIEFSSSKPQPLTYFHTNSSSSNNNNSNHPKPSPLPISGSPKSNLLSPFHIPPCNTTFQLRRIQKRKKNLTVIENFIMGWKHVKCNESITYTTHADYRYFDNLVPLVDRWNGPVSLAIYCPGADLEESLKLISYLKLCTSSNIDKWVTFHLIYDTKYVKRPAKSYTKHGDMPWLDTLYQQGKWKDCSHKPIFSKANYTFRIQNGLLYPINIARNIARAAATTYFVLASDIELYPSINLIPSFMEMLDRLQKVEEEKNNYNTKKNKFTAAAAAVANLFFPMSNSNSSSPDISNGNDGANKIAEQMHWSSSAPHPNTIQQQEQRLSDLHRQSSSKHVFVLPVFEVKKEIQPCQVETKEQLVFLLKHRAGNIFHQSICPQCHTFPKYKEWKETYTTSGAGALEDYQKHNCSSHRPTNTPSLTTKVIMQIFHKSKRKHPHQLWEPIFIGTKEEPFYDERLSWEGLRDKMVSGYIMCALDYDFYILDNAFLVHKPGIRKVNHLVTKIVMNQDRLINYRIRSELLKKFGKHDECAL